MIREYGKEGANTEMVVAKVAMSGVSVTVS